IPLPPGRGWRTAIRSTHEQGLLRRRTVRTGTRLLLRAIQRDTKSAARPPKWDLPRIVPNRKQLDDRLPVLGSTILYERLGYGDLLLATDQTLFDPAKPSGRTPASAVSPGAKRVRVTSRCEIGSAH